MFVDWVEYNTSLRMMGICPNDVGAEGRAAAVPELGKELRHHRAGAQPTPREHEAHQARLAEAPGN